MDELKRYIGIAKKLKEGKASSDEIRFFIEYSPQIDEAKIDKIVKGGDFATKEDAYDALREVSIKLQTDPQYKQQVLDIAQEAEAGKTSENLSQGINMVLGGLDIANSIKQINASNQASARSRRPSRPVIPRRDMYLQQALRNAEEGTMDASRALAPAEAQINDQYLSDVNAAKIASGGQLGAYGAYRQLAANNRNRASLNLVPLADEVRRGQQARYDSLLGQRMQETQNMFQNQASLYP